MILSKHFTLKELTHSDIADEEGIDNLLDEDDKDDHRIIDNLEHLCQSVLERVRRHYKVPITPTSGYRCPELNHHPRMKGSKVSQHMRGEAVDFEVKGVSNLELATWIAGNLVYDQLILERYDPKDPTAGWVHVSFKRQGNNRQDTRTIGKSTYAEGLPTP